MKRIERVFTDFLNAVLNDNADNSPDSSGNPFCFSFKNKKIVTNSRK
jgi:hypothetical protein